MKKRQVSILTKYPIILLDADDTLFDFPRAEEEALCDALRKMGVSPDREMVKTYSEINDGFWKMLERGEIEKSELRVARFEAFCKHYALDVEFARLALAYTDALATKSYLLPGAMEACLELAKHCELYIITNGIATVQRGRFEPSPLCPLFKDLFISEEIGAEKPHKEYFDAVASRIAGFDPRKALVVGDSLTSDIRGGIAAGIDTCWFNRKGKPLPEDLSITYVIQRIEELLPLVLIP